MIFKLDRKVRKGERSDKMTCKSKSKAYICKSVKIHFKYIPSSLSTAEDWQEGVACNDAVGVAAAAHCLPRSLRVPKANLPEIAAEDIVLKVMPASNQLTTVSLQHVEAMMLSQ